MGAGQMIRWKKCFIWVYISSDTSGEPDERYDICDGQGTVPKGVKLYIGGKGGLWKTG